MKYKLGFIGAGNMAEAVAKAAINQGLVSADKIIASDTNETRRELFADLGINVTQDSDHVVTESRQIMLAVKPQVFPDVAKMLAKVDAQRQVVISIMAGITTAKIQELAGQPLRIIRVMPNTPMMVMQGMAGVACGQCCQPGDDEFAMKLFGAAGKAVSVSESDIDAITAISGSGPAYIFYLAEAMQDAADKMGLSEDGAVLAQQTILGAALLLGQSQDSAGELRRKVTSPGGTTQAALEYMESKHVRESITQGILRAQARSIELGK
ncbi:MAG TPA: pyrroline-5-carboxylate reductase [Phycisphaerales bacterium]|nr:pyrroline-5-carboxylate reductase [Phycisphaerales bacterium]|tara:strand:- start:19424 stop:20224 length:801 start_codon:yes stop_codon:yes gene_type:complete